MLTEPGVVTREPRVDLNSAKGRQAVKLPGVEGGHADLHLGAVESVVEEVSGASPFPGVGEGPAAPGSQPSDGWARAGMGVGEAYRGVDPAASCGGPRGRRSR